MSRRLLVVRPMTGGVLSERRRPVAAGQYLPASNSMMLLVSNTWQEGIRLTRAHGQHPVDLDGYVTNSVRSAHGSRPARLVMPPETLAAGSATAGAGGPPRRSLARVCRVTCGGAREAVEAARTERRVNGLRPQPLAEVDEWWLLPGPVGFSGWTPSAPR